MILSVLDPSLLIFEVQAWREKTDDCYSRFDALLRHLQISKRFKQPIVLTNNFASKLHEFFPWNDYRSVPELRDLMTILLNDLQKSLFIEPVNWTKLSYSPNSSLCRYVSDSKILECWLELIYTVYSEVSRKRLECSPNYVAQSTSWAWTLKDKLFITIHDEAEEGITIDYELPVVISEFHWIEQLRKLDWWPEIDICVELCFKSRKDMQEYEKLFQPPLSFSWTDDFLKSVEKNCPDSSVKEKIIEAITKRVYGILDASLGDEPFNDIRRMRVTDFWRIHYTINSNKISFEEFGPHSIGGVD